VSLIHTLTILICLAALFSYVNHRLLKLPITIGLMAVQPMGDGVQLVLGIARQVYALGQVLAQQAIDVLVGTVLLGAVRIGKEDLDREPLGQLLVVGRSPMSSWIRAFETPGNLLRRAALGQMRLHVLPQPRIQECARPPRLTCVGCGPHLCRAGATGGPRVVLAQLAVHGAGGASSSLRHRPQRLALGQAQTHGLTVYVTQVRVALF
jgi:hypothetical protein